MARTINEIAESIRTDLQNRTDTPLSTSKVAEWQLWTYVVATGIYSFEVILDLFRDEMETLTTKITPGTVRWYNEMCRRFQNRHPLLFDEETAMLYYEMDDPDARIVKIVAINEAQNQLLIKVATMDDAGKIKPLEPEQLYNFKAYIDAIKFAGVNTNVISTTEDKIRYRLNVWHDPAIPNTIVRDHITAALETFKMSLDFDSMIYTQKFIDTVMHVPGVVTCQLSSLERCGVSDAGIFKPVDVCSVLESGYFEYDRDSSIELKTINELNK